MPCRVTKIGAQHAIVVPATLMRYFGWKPGRYVWAVFRAGARPVRVRLRVVTKHTTAAPIPAAMVAVLKVKSGDTIVVPFHEWRQP